MSMTQRTTAEILSGMIEIANSNLEGTMRIKSLMDYLAENWVVDVCALYILVSQIYFSFYFYSHFMA